MTDSHAETIWPEHDLEIDPAPVDRLRSTDDDAFLLLDCRTQDEWDIAHIDGALMIPMQEIQERVSELRGRESHRIVVYCHSGRRSLMVTQFLMREGFESVRSMRGGIDRWSVEIDSSIARY